MGPEVQRVGFIGIGRMGAPMAGHLAAAGFDVMVWDTNPEAVEAFHRQHGGESLDPAEIAAGSDAVVTMLPTSRIVRDVVLGSGDRRGLAEAMKSGSVLVDTSTSDPLDTVSLGEALAPRGIAMVDAPVAGGVVFARDGTLDILAGGEGATVERVRPMLMAMGRSCTHCGALGAAHALKALNNYVNAAVLAINLEAIVAGRKFGINESYLLEALEAATMGRNHPYEKKIKPQILTRRFGSGMDMGLIAKDVGIARDLVTKQGVRGPLVKAVAKLWQDATEEFGFTRDQTEIARYWEESAGVALGDAPKSNVTREGQ